MAIPSDADLEAGVENTATATTVTPDPAPGNDSATATVTTSAISDLIAMKWDTTAGPPPPGTPPTPLVAGSTVTYYLAVGNLGPSDATTARVADTLPPGVTYVSSVPECGFAPPDQVVCDLPTVPAGLAAVFPVTVRLDADLPAGTRLTNSVEITLTDPDRTDPVSSNNFAAVTNPVATSADLFVVKRTYSLDLPTFDFVIPSAAPAGTPTGYLIEIRNDGPSVARDVVLVDTSTMTDFFLNQVRLVRPGVEPVDLTADCSFSGGDLSCPLGDLPAFAPGDPSWTIQVDGVTLSSATAGSYENTAVLTSATPDSDVRRQLLDGTDHRHRARRDADHRQDERRQHGPRRRRRPRLRPRLDVHLPADRGQRARPDARGRVRRRRCRGHRRPPTGVHRERGDAVAGHLPGRRRRP